MKTTADASLSSFDDLALGTVQTRLADAFIQAGIDDAQTDAVWLICAVTGLTRSELTLHRQERLTAAQSEHLANMASQRIARRPLQYIIGTQPFMGLDIKVDERVFIPRGDTERLAEAAIDEVKRRGGARLLELCTGSGCITAAVCALSPVTKAIAVELREDTAQLAKENIERYTENCDIRTGDLYNALKSSDGLFDIIVSNPPYIPTGDIASLQPEVRVFEPLEALDGGVDGLDIYRRIISEADKWLVPNGVLMLEVGHTQAATVIQLMQNKDFTDIRVIRDYGGNERVITGRNIYKQ